MSTSVQPLNLRCESRCNPVGIDHAQPVLSWQLPAGRQSAYQIRVADTWDSGWVVSDAHAVPCQGPPLSPATRYQWQVRVQDEHGRASDWSAPAVFVTGVRDWPAQWIGSATEAASVTLRRQIVVRAGPWCSSAAWATTN